MQNQTQILFYEREYYFLSNFSAFGVDWKGAFYMTSEHVYQAEKFLDEAVREKIRSAKSAHDAKQIARANIDLCRDDWESAKLGTMKDILLAKVSQHDYIKEKLVSSGDATLIENSPQDSFWGWGPNKDGQNQLGKLWMEIRSELRTNTA